MTPVAEADTGAALRKVLDRYPRRGASLISVLQDFQAEANYLPRTALDQVAAELGVPRSQVYHVATFYRAFSLKPRGRHTVSICLGTACHVKGVEKVLDMLRAELKVDDGETTPDGLFTVQSVRCLGCCSLAPAVMIGRQVFGGVTPTGLRKILKRYRDGKG
jgi:NADH:ubiquinone oxidoreductase subunit E